MESKKSKSVYYLITETEIYRTDEILKQINQWHKAFKTGRLVQVPNADPEALDEFEIRLEQTYLECRRLARNDTGLPDSDF